MAPTPTVDLRALVVVVGGGFAGLTACRKLAKRYRVVLIDAKEYSEYSPGILRAFVSPKDHSRLSCSLQKVCDSMGAKFMWGEVKTLDLEAKAVNVAGMVDLKEVQLKFDFLILATGSIYNVSLAAKKATDAGHSFKFYSTCLEGLVEETGCGQLDERFLGGRRAQLEVEAKALEEIETKRGAVVVVGAGFVGVELATELKYFFPGIQVVLTEQKGECLGHFPLATRKYVQAYMDKIGIKSIYGFHYKVSVTNGDSFGDASQLQVKGIQAERVYMAVGLRACNHFMPQSCMAFDGYIRTNHSMQVIGKGGMPVLDGTLFAVGSCCHVQDLPEHFSIARNCFPAEEMAAIAASNVCLVESNHGGRKVRNLKEFKWRSGMGFVSLSLGPKNGVFVTGIKGNEKGCTLCCGGIAALFKDFLQWSKVDQVKMGCMGRCIWGCVH